MANPIRPEDLPPVPALAANDAFIVDTGAGVYKATPDEIVVAGDGVTAAVLAASGGSALVGVPGGGVLSGSAGSGGVGFLQSGTGAVATTIQAKLRESVSITDFGAVGNDSALCDTAWANAITYLKSIGGGRLEIPQGTFRHADVLEIDGSNIEVWGHGDASVLHLVNPELDDRTNALAITGTEADPLTNVRLSNFRVLGDVTHFEADGTPKNAADETLANGGGIIATFVDRFSASGVLVYGFQDGGIFGLNCNYGSIVRNVVEMVGQGAGWLANTVDVRGNILALNIIRDVGTYNGAHLEGGFGPSPDTGALYGTVIAGNTIENCRGAGINIELAPTTSCTGNTMHNCGVVGAEVTIGLKVFGSLRSTIVANVVTGSSGFGIGICAGSSECVVSGNITQDNGASMLLTDSSDEGGPPIQVTQNVRVGFDNNFDEEVVTFDGNVSARPMDLYGELPQLYLRAQSATTRNAQVVFANSIGGDLWRFGVDVETNNGSTTFGFYRDGVGTCLGVTAAGQVQALASYAVAGTKVLGAQGAAVADATDAATAITQLNALLARCRAHGLIAAT